MNEFVDLKPYPRLPEIKFVSSTGCELAKTEAEVPLGRQFFIACISEESNLICFSENVTMKFVPETSARQHGAVLMSVFGRDKYVPHVHFLPE